MYKCTDCGKIFREPDKWSEHIVEFDRSFSGCPRCGSEYYDVYPDSGDEDEDTGEEWEYEDLR